MSESLRVLVSIHDDVARARLRSLFADSPLRVRWAPSSEGPSVLVRSDAQVLVLETAAGADARGLEATIVERARELAPGLRVLLLCPSGDDEARAHAVALGAAPFDSESLEGLPSRVERLVGAADQPPSGPLDLRDLHAPIAVLDALGWIVDATVVARSLLAKFRLPVDLPAPLPDTLAQELASVPFGSAIVWRPPADLTSALGFTRYQLGADHEVLLMREITDMQREFSRRLHQQRLEATGGLVARIAHDLRTPLSSIVYNADLLDRQPAGLDTTETVRNIQVAAEGMRRAIAALLDFARLGPPVDATPTLREIVSRVATLVRPAFRFGSHELTVSIHDEEARIRGNPMTAEQILVNLLVNAAEAASAPVQVRLSTERLAPSGTGRNGARTERILVRVADNGPGIPPEIASRVFEPFFSSKANGTGLGLTVAREAATSLGGEIVLEPTAVGCSFVVILPAARLSGAEEARP